MYSIRYTSAFPIIIESKRDCLFAGVWTVLIEGTHMPTKIINITVIMKIEGNC